MSSEAIETSIEAAVMIEVETTTTPNIYEFLSKRKPLEEVLEENRVDKKQGEDYQENVDDDEDYYYHDEDYYYEYKDGVINDKELLVHPEFIQQDAFQLEPVTTTTTTTSKPKTSTATNNYLDEDVYPKDSPYRSSQASMISSCPPRFGLLLLSCQLLSSVRLLRRH